MEKEWLLLSRFFLDAPNKWACSRSNQLENRKIKNKTNGVNFMLEQKTGQSRLPISLKIHAKIHSPSWLAALTSCPVASLVSPHFLPMGQQWPRDDISAGAKQRQKQQEYTKQSLAQEVEKKNQNTNLSW